MIHSFTEEYRLKMQSINHGTELDHIGVYVDAPDELAKKLSEGLGAEISPTADHVDGLKVLLGRTVLRLYEKRDSAQNEHYVALRIADTQGLRERLEASGHETSVTAMGNGQRLPKSDFCGIPLLVLDQDRSVQEQAAKTIDGNLIGVDHVGIASEDNRTAKRLFSELVGLPIESEQTDTETMIRVEQFVSNEYGVRSVSTSVSDRPTGLRALFVSMGSEDFEFLQDLAVDDTVRAGESSSTAGDRSAISRYIQHHGPGFHHIALRVRDINLAIDRASKSGLRMIDLQPRPGSRRAEIAFVHPATAGGILWHFVQR